MKKIVLSGMRPTGKLHLGHWLGTLSAWVELQEKYKCFFMAADWHAFMSEYKNPKEIKRFVLDNLCDWLAYGIDPEKNVLFVQSEVSGHLELFIVLSALTPLGWLFRCPTFKEQIAQLKEKEINTFAFLGYPVLQAADILLYKANYVPVGEDQLPHLELAREITRRFHFVYQRKVFIEPQPFLTSAPRLLGIDRRKMSKSYNNYIALDEEDKTIEKKVLSMLTDPARKKKSDCGHPEFCNVFTYYKICNPQAKDQVYDWCVNAKRGCVDCKKGLSEVIKEFIAPKREKKKKILKKKDYLYDILSTGKREAERAAAKTIGEVKEAVGL